MKDTRSILMNEYEESKYKRIIEKVILHGYRMLVIDSYQDIIECLVGSCGMRSSAAGSWILSLISKANAGLTETGHNTCVLLIQQVTKGGVFVGKNNLKHNTTAFLEFRFSENRNQRYCEYTKNRRNGSILYKRLYYFLNEKNEVMYDEKLWNEDRDREKMIISEKNRLDKANDDFLNIFINKDKINDETEDEIEDEELEDEYEED